MGVAELAILGVVDKVRSWIVDLSYSSSPEISMCCKCRCNMDSSIASDQFFCACSCVLRSESSGYVNDRGEEIAAKEDKMTESLQAQQYLRCSTARSMGDSDDDEMGKLLLFSPTNDFSQDALDTDLVSGSTNSGRQCFMSPASSPSGCLCKSLDKGTSVNGHFSVDSPGCGRASVVGSDDLDSAFDTLSDYNMGYVGTDTKKLDDFERDARFWYPPEPEDEGDDVESRLFVDDCDEDNAAEESGEILALSSFDSAAGSERPQLAQKEILRHSLLGYFRALVAELLKGQGISTDYEQFDSGWLDIVSSLAWQAADFLKLDTGSGGSMDPGDYVKVKCIASGSPGDSTFVKGIICSKNLKHKRMLTQYKNPRIFLLGGALEYQKVSNNLASINNVLEQEKEYLRDAVVKIESYRPNILLVEKSVSPDAQELLAKEISLVINVKKSLLERIARCTVAQICSIDNLSSARLGQCQNFRVEKFTECFPANNTCRKSVKTLMFFEGCPRRLGCTVLLRGACHEELKKVKRVVQFSIFAAYQLSLETSFLADEGATLPRISPRFLTSCDCQIKASSGPCVSQDNRMKTGAKGSVAHVESGLVSSSVDKSLVSKHEECDSPSFACRHGSLPHSPINGCLPSRRIFEEFSGEECTLVEENCVEKSGIEGHIVEMMDRSGESLECFSAENQQSILVSLSVTCALKGTVCERSQLFRIKFYGSSDKPLGRFLLDDLFNQASYCPTCKEQAETHVRCYTHRQGSLTIGTRRIPSKKLPGEGDGKIWMWHRCLKCKFEDGAPPVTKRVLMSDAACRLSFGKFLELSFSNHATANRVAGCGHSLQRDCLRFYGSGSMVAVFRYTPVNILSVSLPPIVLDFVPTLSLDWVKCEIAEISSKKNVLYKEISSNLDRIEKATLHAGIEHLESCIFDCIAKLRKSLEAEKEKYDVLLHAAAMENINGSRRTLYIFEINWLRRELLHEAARWSSKLNMMELLCKGNHISMETNSLLDIVLETNINGCMSELRCGIGRFESSVEESNEHSENFYSLKQDIAITPKIVDCETNNIVEMDLTLEPVEGFVGSAGHNVVSCQIYKQEGVLSGSAPSSQAQSESSLSDKIDLAWTGSDRFTVDFSKGACESLAGSSLRKVYPVRVHSFDSYLRLQRNQTTSPSHLPDMKRAYSEKSARAFVGTKSLSLASVANVASTTQTTFGSFSAYSLISNGIRLPPIQNGLNDIIIYDEDPSSIIAYAITSQKYYDFLSPLENQMGTALGIRSSDSEHAPKLRSDSNVGRSSVAGMVQMIQQHANDCKESHFRMDFEDENPFAVDKVKFSVTCYFAKQFDVLRKICCSNEMGYVHSLSRCKRWRAQGGKSNVYFAKTVDERLVIKQVTKAELESFEEFAHEYFKYLSESLTSGSPTCLAKVLGLYQVTVRNLHGGKELKMDLMVMENIFFQRKISRVYDLKGSLRSRYNPDTSGTDKVLLDLNLLETLRTKPILLGSKAKRRLERAVWNDSSFLALVDVMDYSLLVGIDEEKMELVIGIIDFLRQYTWDKQLETWVKASGILGGPKNTLPTVISPTQYKKRFRKAMSSYFFTVPDQWSSGADLHSARH